MAIPKTVIGIIFIFTTELGLLPGLAATPVPMSLRQKQQHIKSVVAHLVGVMDTTAQALADTQAPSVRMTTCVVQNVNIQASPSTVYLYQEQALTSKLDKPYRQRFLQIQPSLDGLAIESKSFKPPHPDLLVGLCQKPDKQRWVNQYRIGTAVCSVFLQPTAQGYIGETPASGCPVQMRGAVKLTNRVTLHAAGMDTWDRGYDAQGRQVWGAAAQSYQYRWVDHRP